MGVDRNHFQDIEAKEVEDDIQTYLGYLSKAEFFAPLEEKQRRNVASALVEMHFSKGETIFEQGEEGNSFYILYEGDVSVTKDNAQVATLKGTGETVQIFGELALMSGQPRAATIKVTSEQAKTLTLSKVAFETLVAAHKQ